MNNASRKQIKTTLELISTQSNKLYQQCKADNCPDILDPLDWINNQDKMRKAWERYLSTFDNKPDIIRKLMLNNSFAIYMRYMYDNYPANFGNTITEHYKRGSMCDGVKIYYHLTHAKNAQIKSF